VTDRTRLYIGLAVIVVGLIWTGQGLGWIGGSFMTGEAVWVLVGPLVAVAGALLVARSRRGPD